MRQNVVISFICRSPYSGKRYGANVNRSRSAMIILYVPFDHLLDKNNGPDKVYYPRNLVHRKPRIRKRHVCLGAQISNNFWHKHNLSMRERIDTIKLVKVVCASDTPFP